MTGPRLCNGVFQPHPPYRTSSAGPQGAPISPLLSNLYMRRFVLGWKKLGHEKRLAAYIVNYADGTPVQTLN